jgi:ubiquinone/menaquinone biosynthesis C-methylase UbiE
MTKKRKTKKPIMHLFRKIYYYFLTKKIIKKNVHYQREKYEDRNVLEAIIFPYVLDRFDPKTILDIGREDYQKFYNDFFKNRELWTIDSNPERKKYGSPEKHITDNVSNLKKYFQNNHFDFILMNGVLGWGLDSDKAINRTFNAIYEILKPEGIFILGWNDSPLDLDKIEGLNKLKKFNFKPLNTDHFRCVNGNHQYGFYIK